MKKTLSILLAALLSCMLCNAQKISDSGYRTVGFIKSDGTVQDSGYRTIGHIVVKCKLIRDMEIFVIFVKS